ncbi:hypothetical protein SAMN02910301_1480 [Lachnospiraceae bacterium XBD2001]|nr:hypothetical protein SAMN02910301_1480 [Lachnospiraceae bacterium XBD2001]
MSKKLVEGTIKIASVGMAAVMATTPMATLAADADVVSSDAQPTVEDIKPADDTTTEKQEIQDASEAVADAQKAVRNSEAEEEADQGANDKMETALASNAQMGQDAITSLPTAQIPAEGKEDAAEGELSDLAQNISDMKDANTKADAAETQNNGYITDAGNVASELNADMSTAASDFAARRDAMNNATTTTDTDAAYAQAVAIADAAQAEFNEKSAEYDAILQKINDNNAVIQAAQERYDEAVANASENLEDAKTELAAAKQLATELEAAAEAKREALATAGAGAQAILDAQAKRNPKDYKNGEKPIFEAIAREYYIPSVLGGTLVAWDYDGITGEKEVGKTISYDGGAHNYKATYTTVNEDGETETHVVYLNYKWDKKTGDLIIFEKNYEKIDLYRYVKKEGGTKFYEEKIVNGKSVIQVGNQTYDVHTIDGDKYILLNEGEAVAIPVVTEGTETNGNVTVETSISNEEATYSVKADGQVVKTVTGDVTKVTKTEKTLSASGYTYESADAAIEAANTAIANGLAEGESVLGDVTVETSYETTSDVTYDAVFTATINIKGWSKKIQAIAFDNDVKEKAEVRALLKEDIENIIKDAGYTLTQEVNTSGVELSTNQLWVPISQKRTWTVKDNEHSVITVTFKKAGLSAGQVTTKDGASADSKAKENANTAIASVNPSIAGVSVNKKEATNVQTGNATTLYAYNAVNYTTQSTETLPNQTIATTTYESAKLQHLQTEGMFGNKAWDKYQKTLDPNDVIMVEKTDQGLADFLQAHNDKKAAYATVRDQAKAAKEAYETAEKKVNAIQKSIDALKEQAKVAGLDANQIALQAELTVALEQAERDMTEAEETLKGITGQLAALLTERDARILALTPAPAAPAAAGAAPVVAATPVLAAVPGAGVAAAAPAFVPGADVATPQANVQLDNNNNVTADDVQASLANMTLDDVTEANTIMGWWWLLIIALLGGTGYTMYRKHQQKKAAQTIDKTK